MGAASEPKKHQCPVVLWKKIAAGDADLKNGTLKRGEGPGVFIAVGAMFRLTHFQRPNSWI